MSVTSGTTLWAAFGADECSGETLLSRSLRTVAAFIDRHPELGALSVNVNGAAGRIGFNFHGTDMSLGQRVEAWQLLTEALDAEVEMFVYDDGQVLLWSRAKVAGGRRVDVDLVVARREDHSGQAVTS